MPAISPDTIVQALHQIGVLMWVGSLFFVRLVVLPASKKEKNPMIRMAFRMEAYRHLFRWGTLGLLLIWGSGLWRLGIPDLSQMPLSIQIMTGAAAATLALHLLGYLALYLNMEIAVDEERLIRSAMNNFWLRKLIWANLFLGLAAAIAGSLGSRILP